MPDELDERYQEIMRRLAEQRERQNAPPPDPAQETLAQVLDSLDAYGKLEKLRASGAVRAYGPRAFEGTTPTPWLGAVLWRKGGGYYGYQTLHVLGVWAIAQPGAPLVVVGGKRLRYTAPTYEAEAYHKLIRRGFTVYYNGDASPPPDTGRVLAARYHAGRRLELREAVREALTGLVANT